MQNLDQSQKPHEPTPTRSLRDIGRVELVTDDSDAAKENRERAGRELAMIEELKANTAFRWFMAEFIDTPFKASFDAFRDETVEDADFWTVRRTYNALRKVKAAIIEREIAHREQISENDPDVKVLRAQLAAL